MGIQFHQFRKKKQWVVTWRNPWTGKKHTQSFADEAAAMAFEAAQAEIAAKERALLRKARKQTAGRSRINVKDLLDSYFRRAHTNPLTIRQAWYPCVKCKINIWESLDLMWFVANVALNFRPCKASC